MDKAKYLAMLLGEERATAYLEKTGLKNKILKEAEIEHKEKDEEPKVEEPKVEATPAPVTTVVNNAPADSAAVVAQVLKEMDIEGLNAFVIKAQEAIEKVPVLEELVKSLQTGQEEQLEKVLTPPAAKFAWSQANRPTADESNVVDQTEKEKNQPGVPDDYWLSNATKTAPIKVQ